MKCSFRTCVYVWAIEYWVPKGQAEDGGHWVGRKFSDNLGWDAIKMRLPYLFTHSTNRIYIRFDWLEVCVRQQHQHRCSPCMYLTCLYIYIYANNWHIRCWFICLWSGVVWDLSCDSNTIVTRNIFFILPLCHRFITAVFISATVSITYLRSLFFCNDSIWFWSEIYT